MSFYSVLVATNYIEIPTYNFAGEQALTPVLFVEQVGKCGESVGLRGNYEIVYFLASKA
jgi:hypothetical protein